MSILKRQTGRELSGFEAVARYCEAAAPLGERGSLASAVDAWLATSGTVARKDLAEAVAEFLDGRAAMAQSRDGGGNGVKH